MRTCTKLGGMAVLATALALSGCATSRSVIEAEVARTNTQTVLAFEETVYNKHQVKAGFERYVGPTFIQHDPKLAAGKDAAVKALDNLLNHEFPSSRIVVKRTIAQRSLVAVQLLWVPKPEDGAGAAIVDIFRLENNRIVEHWIVAQDVPEKAANDNSMF